MIAGSEHARRAATMQSREIIEALTLVYELDEHTVCSDRQRHSYPACRV